MAGGAHLSDCLIVEVFAGTGRVTASLRQMSLVSCFGVDHIRHKSAAAPIVVADLNTPQGERLLWSWLRNPLTVGVFLAPPCGSASRARQIPLKRKFTGKSHGPKPLRNDTHPNGIPNLSETDRNRVSLTNCLYHLTAQVVAWAVAAGLLVCVENPQFSLFWATTFWTEVAHLVDYTVFHSCQYGSTRQKKTMLAFNANEFHVICDTCNGQSSKHKHAKWGYNARNRKFATAEETAYPMGLARLIAVVFVRALLNLGVKAPPDTLDAVQPISLQSLQKMRAVTGQQATSSRIPPQVPTYKSRICIAGDRAALPQFQVFQRLREPVRILDNPPQFLPKGSKLLSLSPSTSFSTQGNGANVEGQTASHDCLMSADQVNFPTIRVTPPSERGRDVVQTWGVPWSPDEFVEKAILSGHPMSLGSFLPHRLEDTVKYTLRSNVEQRVGYRLQTMKFWLKRAIELKKDEADLHSSLHHEVQSVLKGKRITVWKEMLQAINYEDMDVVAEFCEGAHLTGEVAPTGLWPKRFSPAAMTANELKHVASAQRSSVTFESFKFMGADVLESVWEQTMDEVSRGELLGPIPLRSIDEGIPLSRRFGIRQGQKIRCVDDYSQSSINACVQTCESPKPHTVDVLASLCVAIMSEGGLKDKWMARSFDLKRAYRQCAINPADAGFSHIVVADPSRSEVFAFRMLALPFGSIRSVHSFLRVSHSIWAVAVSMFRICWTNYFDDYVALGADKETTSITNTVTLLFKLLGWQFAESGPKAPDFAQSLTALGIELDVSDLHQGHLKLDNTADRKEELISLLSRIIADGKLPKHEALKLRGRLQFAAGQIFGRIAKRCLAFVTEHAYSASGVEIGPDALSALCLFKQLLSRNVPRCISMTNMRTWFLFTDASYERSEHGVKAGVGAVLVDAFGYRNFFLSEWASNSLERKINVTQRKTAIFEFEFFAVFCAMLVWKKLLTGSQVVVYTDNDGVKDSLVSCRTSSSNSAPILAACLQLEFEVSWCSWFSRVPTESNVSDNPSRGEVEDLLKSGAQRTVCDLQTAWDSLLLLSTRGGDNQQGLSQAEKKGTSAAADSRGAEQRGLKEASRRHAI